jgi:hypothetical protein
MWKHKRGGEIAMRSWVIPAICLGACLALLTGCANFQGPQLGGVSLGVLAGDTTYPGALLASTKVNLDSGDFEIMQTITAETYSESILGMVSTGDSGYGKLFQQAQAVGADDVINIKVDTHQVRYVLGLYTKSTTKLTGTAIKWKKK